MKNILLWCDNIVTKLKKNHIDFRNGFAILPEEAIYREDIEMITPFVNRSDIPENLKSTSLICYFMHDERLFPRLRKIDQDIAVLKEFGGICGFDLSPSIGMLKPRQRFSLFINSLYNCYCAVNGIKVLPNSRSGEIGLVDQSKNYYKDAPCVTGMLGCRNNGFKKYGLFQLKYFIRQVHPSVLYVYGALSKKEAADLFYDKDFIIKVFPDRRNRVRNGAKSYSYIYTNGTVSKLYDSMTFPALEGGM